MRRTSLLVLTLLLTAAHAHAEVKLEIGPDTTVIDGPINPDGTINYLAYLNQKLSEGVTPENNFAVDVAMVIPEQLWASQAYREKVFKGLGVEMSVDGPFFTTMLDAIADDEDITSDESEDQLWLDALSGPWTADEYPKVKQWLDKQNAALDRVKNSAIQKDRYYFPWVVVAEELEALEMVLLPGLCTIRGVGRGLVARAELNIASGRLDDAISDVWAMHQVANQIAREPQDISWLVGVSIHSMAASVIEDIAESKELTSEIAKRMIVEAQQHRRVQPYGDVYISSLRFTALDGVLQRWKGRGNLLSDMWLDEQFNPLLESTEYDPSVTMRAINDWAARWMRVGQIEDYHELLAKAESLERVSKLKHDQALRLLNGDPAALRLMRKEVLGSNKETSVVTSIVVAYAYLNPGVYYQTQARINMKLSLAPVALGIGGYHAEHGEYPLDLQALVPGYLEALPLDFATGELPVYRVEDGTAVVYSLGTDLEDDGGVDDPNEGDIVFRIER